MLTLLIYFIFTVLQLVCSAHAQLSSFDAREATIDTVQDDLFKGLATCRGVVSSFLSRIESLNDRINAVITLNPHCLSEADVQDNALAAGNTTGSLFCIPILLKDNYDTDNMDTTGGSLALSGSQPSVDAPVVRALKRAGAIVLGKANLHELALEGLSISSAGGQTINPYDFSRTPGGSSGGSGAAVAASFSVFATGTDTVNSLRSPASANSLFSVRPTRGLITRTGVIPISFTQDALGPITRTVKDAAIALTVMTSIGFDASDNTTSLVPVNLRGVNYAAFLSTGSLKGVRLGVLNGFFNRTASNETNPVNAAIDTLIAELEAASVTVVPVNDPLYNATAILQSHDIQRFEFRECMDAYLSRPCLRGSYPKTFADLYNSSKFLVIPAQYEYITTALSSSPSNDTYSIVQQRIHNLTLSLHQTFSTNNLDALIYPQQRNLVVKLGSPSQSGRNGILAAVTGSPVVTVPAGFSGRTKEAPVGVPIGMEILGEKWSEEKLLKIAYQIEMLIKMRRPPKFAEKWVETKAYEQVPLVRPNTRNGLAQYPFGVLE
ncbi:hypothetical protein MMC18_001747 [Xylographa bjoerkii]|nr:hypothetical protein [Xylographa bjoerkii]